MNVSISAKHLRNSTTLVPTPAPAAILQAGTRIAEILAQGRAVETGTLRESMAAACGGSDTEGLWLWKDAYEAGEVAQVLFLRRFWPAIRAKAATPAARLAMLTRIAGMLPTQSRRSEESEAFQQFSTPLPLGYVAALAAGLRPGERLLEPSAGTGLLAVHAELAGARLHLNELAMTRAGLLGHLYPAGGVTQLDAAQIHDRLDARVVPDVTLMNPPFSVAAGVEGRYRDATADHLRSALSRLAPGGRLVAITGEGFRPDRPSSAAAFAGLAERGGRLVFSAGLSGRAYARHGTTVDVRLSVFDRMPAGEGGAGVAPLGISPDVGALLDAVLAGVPPRLALVPVSPSSPTSTPAPRSAIPGLTHKAITRPAATRPAPAPVAIESADPVAYAVIEELPAMLAAEAALYETYALETLRIAGAQPHPTPLVQSTAMASVRLPRPSHAPRLPAPVVTDGLLSECQLETVIYAGAAHARHLPGHWSVDETGTILSAAAEGTEGAVRFRQGFFLGDGTGAGKGRQVAGVILDNWMQGRRRALWISKNDALLEDARRDWRHLGREPLQIVPLSRFAPGKPVTLTEGILFTTFATLRGGARNGAGSRLDQICDWLGPDFDGVIALDEAHALANAAAGSGDRGVVEASQQGRAGLALQYRLPDARVLYVSATGAVTVEKLAYAHRLGLWGGGAFPFPTRADFVSAMQQGGLAAMEVLARDLKALGLYTARSLSYAGVEVEMLEHGLTPEQTAIYDAYADAFQVIHTHLDAALKASGVTGTSGTLNRAAKSAARSAFESSKQRFFNHLLTAMKCPSLIAAVEAGIEAGHAAVIQIVSTGEALMERRLAEIPSEEWGDLQVDVTPREYVIDYLAHAFPTQLYEPYSDDSGTILSRPVTDADGQPVQCREAVEARGALIEHLCGLEPVQSALDQILHRFGTEVVAEVTGRSRRIVRRMGKDGVDRLVLQNRPAAANLAETQAFQDDEKRILVFSDAGGTGRSYHADRGAKNQRLRVHYLLEAGWKADAAVQGLGRTNRTNQAQPPLFRPVTTDVKGEKRFLSTIARRLDTLGAITRGQRQTGGQGLFRPEDNLEGPYAATALRQLYWAIVRGEIAGCPLEQFEAMTGLALTNEAGGLLDELPPIGRFLNRVLALRIAVQNLLFEAFEERLGQVIEGAISAGVYDVGVEVLTAESFTVTDREVAYTHPGSGARTHLLTIAERRRLRPLDLDAALDMMASGFRPVINAKSGRPALMGKAASETREDGSVVARVRIVRPLQRQILDRDAFARSRFEEATPEAFRAAWEAELASLPEFDERTLYVVTGLLLPIWDRLPGIDMRVFRLVTDAGERIVGRVVEPEDLHVTRERLNLGAGTAMAPAEAFAALLGGRASLQLAGGLQVKRARVMSENRVEVIGSSESARAGLKAIGLFSEVIAYRTRLFIPAGERGASILAAVMERHALLRCVASHAHA